MIATGRSLWIAMACVLALGVSAAERPQVQGREPLASGRAVVAEINAARRDPKGYARHLRRLLPLFDGTLLKERGRTPVRTQEGRAAVREAVAFLEAQPRLAPLTFSEGLAKAARDHVRDQGPKGATGHAGSRGEGLAERVARRGTFRGALGENLSYGPSTAREIVIQLLVDDGVAGRGHRKNIFDSRFRAAGAAVGRHATFGAMCAIEFAGAFETR